MTSVFSWQNSISLCPASFCTPGPSLPVTPYCYKRLYFILCYSWVTFHCMCVCVHTTSSLAIHLSVDIWFVSMSWLLWTVLLWTLGCMYLFRIRVLSGWLLFLPPHGCWVVLSLPQVAHLKKISSIKKLLQTYNMRLTLLLHFYVCNPVLLTIGMML